MRQVKKVICEICGQEISKSNYSKHLERHKNNPDSFNESKYKLNHEGLECQFCGRTCKSRKSLCNHERLCKQNPNRQILEGRTTEIIGFNNKGRTAWNKGLTKETDDRVLRQSLKQKGKIGKKGLENPASRPEVKKKISESCLKRSENGEWHTSLAKEHHINYKGEDFHSTWEVAYAIYLDKSNIMWERTKDRFPYNYHEKQHYYTPDFYLPDSNEYVEIKGYATGKDYAKWKYFPKDKKLTILLGKDLIALGLDIKL